RANDRQRSRGGPALRKGPGCRDDPEGGGQKPYLGVAGLMAEMARRATQQPCCPQHLQPVSTYRLVLHRLPRAGAGPGTQGMASGGLAEEDATRTIASPASRACPQG